MKTSAYYRKPRRSGIFGLLIGSGCALWLGLIALIIALNVTIGAWALQYVVSYWTLYFMNVAKHVPFLPAAIGGLFLGEFTIPAAIGTWIVSFIIS